MPSLQDKMVKPDKLRIATAKEQAGTSLTMDDEARLRKEKRRRALEALEAEYQEDELRSSSAVLGREEHKAVKSDDSRETRTDKERGAIKQADVQILLAEQKRKDLERLNAELDAAVARSPTIEQQPSPTRDILGLFTKKRSASKATSKSSGSIEAFRVDKQGAEMVAPPQPNIERIYNAKGDTIKVASGHHPYDAPVSSVNSGERVSLVHYLLPSTQLLAC